MNFFLRICKCDLQMLPFPYNFLQLSFRKFGKCRVRSGASLHRTLVPAQNTKYFGQELTNVAQHEIDHHNHDYYEQYGEADADGDEVPGFSAGKISFPVVA